MTSGNCFADQPASPQRIKDDELIYPIDKLGLEMLPDLVHDQILHPPGSGLARRTRRRSLGSGGGGGLAVYLG